MRQRVADHHGRGVERVTRDPHGAGLRQCDGALAVDREVPVERSLTRQADGQDVADAQRAVVRLGPRREDGQEQDQREREDCRDGLHNRLRPGSRPSIASSASTFCSRRAMSAFASAISPATTSRRHRVRRRLASA